MSADISYGNILLSFIGGLGLFIYGMHVMALGLQKSAGAKMKSLLENVTRSKWLAILVGTGVTAIIQSSSATTVMVVGFVNAGLMNITQSVGLIMGANVGTTVTSWLVASVEWAKYLNPTNFAPLAVGVGAVMALFMKKERYKQIGEMVVGFGILFIGMNTMTNAAYPLRSSQIFRDFFVTLGTNPLLGILVGTVVTSIIQSSSASVGILQSLAATGIVPFSSAVFIIMGQNIGTCVTALLSSIGANRNAKSAAYIHLLFNVFGTVIFSILAMIFFSFINKTIGNKVISLTEISIVHTSFNIACTVIFYPLSNVFVFLAKKMAGVKDSEVSPSVPVHLDDRILETPAFAIESCVKEIIRYAGMAMENLKLATSVIIDISDEKVSKIVAQEEDIDTLAHAITSYLVKLSNSRITKEQNTVITRFFHTVSDIERVSDYCENISELATFLKNGGYEFSDTAKKELGEVIDLTLSCYDNSIKSLETGTKSYAEKALANECEIDKLEEELRERHIKRLMNYECNTSAGVAFLEVITSLERISDHSQNIAEMVLEQR